MLPCSKQTILSYLTCRPGHLWMYNDVITINYLVDTLYPDQVCTLNPSWGRSSGEDVVLRCGSYVRAHLEEGSRHGCPGAPGQVALIIIIIIIII